MIQKLINKFPRLEKFIEDIESIETVKSYINSRPELIDVSVEPKLLIDGVAHPTGVKKTIIEKNYPIILIAIV